MVRARSCWSDIGFLTRNWLMSPIVQEDPLTRVSPEFQQSVIDRIRIRCLLRGDRRQIVPDTCVTVFRGDV